MTRKFRVLIIYPNIPMMLLPPLSIGIFTWILKQEGFEVGLFDTTQYEDGRLSSPQYRVKYLQYRDIFSEANLMLLEWDKMFADFQKKLESFKPDLLLYSFSEDALSRSLQLLRISNSLKIPTIVGGVLATADPEWLINFPEVSMLGVGEGEEVIRDVALRLAHNQDISSVPNLWIKLANGSIIRNPIRPYVNLNEYSTDFSLFDKGRLERPMGGKVHRSLAIETYRGCPYGCTYCNSPLYNKIAKQNKSVYIRRKSIEVVRKEIGNLVKNYNINLLSIVDDCFLARPKKEIEDFIKMYEEFRIPFWFNTRPENCSLDILEKLKDVGAFRVSFGIESGNENFRKTILGRNISNSAILRYFDIINKSRIIYSINCIIGTPYETRDLVFDTIRLIKQIKNFDSITVSTFTPYRGTVLRQRAIEAGWLDPDIRTEHIAANSVLKMPFFTSRQIEGLMRTFPLYVEFDESCWPEIEKAERFELEGEEILDRYSRLFRKRRWKDATG